MEPPNLALLIGKRLDAKDGGEPPMEPDGDEGLMGPDEDAGQKEQMKSSAVASLFDAFKSGDVEAGKTALADFMELCEGEY